MSFIEFEGVRVFHGDCIEVMRSLPENSVDAIVTDPPYGLEFMGKDWDKLQTAQWRGEKEKWQDGLVENHIAHRLAKSPRYGNEPAAMQDWHHGWATEALRVLKPGGHLLAFGGTRTWHRLAVAIEDAGFEVRDSMAWMYGSGFPKSLDVSKAIDKKRDDRADIHAVVSWLESKRQAAGVTRAQVEQHFGTQNIGQALFTITAGKTSRVATWDQWQELKSLLQFDDSMDADVWRLNGRKGKPGEAWAQREVLGETRQGAQQQSTGRYGAWGEGITPTAPATPAAQQWQGWGTALKPAHEPIVVARKPLIGTVAENVLTHGTGALNIDGCRIGYASDADKDKALAGDAFKRKDTSDKGWSRPWMEDAERVAQMNAESKQRAQTGRWPANVILDESQAAELDKQSGDLKPATGRTKRPDRSPFTTGLGELERDAVYDDGGGGASRFFYVAKAGKKERPNVDGVAHPTVKPIALMRYLVRLVTPPGGTVLEPFAGSGTTVEACILEGFDCIAIEMTDDYLPLIAERVRRSTEDKEGRLL